MVSKRDLAFTWFLVIVQFGITVTKYSIYWIKYVVSNYSILNVYGVLLW